MILKAEPEGSAFLLMNNCGCANLRSFVVAASLQRLWATAAKHPCFRREFEFWIVRGKG